MSRAQAEVAAWIVRVCKWPFETVIPAHFSAPLRARPQDLRDAYSFLEAQAATATPTKAPAPAAPFPLGALSALLGGGSAGGRKATERTVVLPERDTAILNALDKLVSATGLAK